MKVKIGTELKCERCRYEWRNRKEDVRICLECKSARWDDPKALKSVDSRLVEKG